MSQDDGAGDGLGGVLEPTTIGVSPTGEEITQINYNRLQVIDLSLRFAAICILVADFVVFFHAFRNKRTLLSMLIFSFLFTQLVGTTCQWLVKMGIIEKSLVVNIFIAVFCFLYSSECFNWVLYMRFAVVSPFKGILNRIVSAWLALESVAVAVSYGLTCYGRATNGVVDRKIGSQVYMVLSIVQACTAMFLSGYFIYKFYGPKLRRIAPNFQDPSPPPTPYSPNPDQRKSALPTGITAAKPSRRDRRRTLIAQVVSEGL
ncbi:hypothetical protein HK102_006252, partial [Quaeritorhiza haematococci]